MAVTFAETVGFFSGAISIWILVQQYKIKQAQQQILESKHKLEEEDHKFKFYEKRKVVFDAIKFFFTRAMGEGRISPENWTGFASAVMPEHFLFESDISIYFKEIENRSFQSIYLWKRLDQENDATKRNELIREQSENFDWFESEKKKLDEKFEKYLRIPIK